MEFANDHKNSEKIYPSFDINSFLEFLVGPNSPEQKNNQFCDSQCYFRIYIYSPPPQNKDSQKKFFPKMSSHGVFFIQ